MNTFHAMTRLAWVIPGIFLAGCAQWSPDGIGVLSSGIAPTGAPTCGHIRAAVGDAVARSRVGDVQARPVSGAPYLRVNRFLAHVGRRFTRQQPSAPFRAWVMRLRGLDDQAFQIELANLPKAELRRLTQQLFRRQASHGRLVDAYTTCARAFIAKLLVARDRRLQLVQAARVSDDYSDIAQVTGLFPLASIPIAAGWKKWKKKHLISFEKSIADLPVRGRVVEWSPVHSKDIISPRTVRRIIQRSKDAALGIPEPKGRDLKRLLHAFAPIWQVDVTGTYDRIGHPSWRNDGRAVLIDRRRPVVFSRTSHAVVDGQIVLQLVYSVWFQERPRKGALDLLGGNLDGVLWRVTLAPNGQPLMYDSIHACGCYHFLFPLNTGGATSWPGQMRNLKERPAVVDGTPVPRPHQRILLRLAAETHYLQGIAIVSRRSPKKQHGTYRLVDADVLRSLPVSPYRRISLYGSDGIVAGTERLERFLLWPTGVKSPGAIRQWGHHAIAFAERRHFDDPVLFDRVFTK